MSGINIPSDSGHLSDQDRADMIEHFAGTVDSQFAKRSMMRQFVPVKNITGTDTAIVRRAGKTDLTAITPGVRPETTNVNFSRAAVTVDTVIIARQNQSLLNEFQADFNVRAQLAMDHGKELGKFFDEAFLIQAIKAAGQTVGATPDLNGAFGDGKVEQLAAAGDELDPDLLYARIAAIITRMQEEDIDTEECAVFVRPTEFDVLLNHDKLIDRDFSMDNGDFADGRLATIKGSPIMQTARVPQTAVTGHPLSNAGNGNAYDLTAAEANVAAVVMHPMSLLAGETVPLTSDIFWDKTEKQWFIDSYMAFGVSNRREDLCGVVRKA